MIFGVTTPVCTAGKAGDDRLSVLEMMFRVAKAAGSGNVRFGSDLTQCPDKCRPSSAPVTACTGSLRPCNCLFSFS